MAQQINSQPETPAPSRRVPLSPPTLADLRSSLKSLIKDFDRVWEEACRMCGIGADFESHGAVDIDLLVKFLCQASPLSRVVTSSWQIRRNSANLTSDGGWRVHDGHDQDPTHNPEITEMTTEIDPVTDINRLIEVSKYDLFSPEVREKLHDFARRAAERFGLPSGMVSIVLDTAQYWAGMYGVDGWKAEAEGTPVEWAFCATVVRQARLYVVEDATIDQDQHDNPLVTDDGQRCYAGAPLITKSGHVLGAYCVAGNEPRTFTEEELTELSAMADDVVAEIENHRLDSSDLPA